MKRPPRVTNDPRASRLTAVRREHSGDIRAALDAGDSSTTIVSRLHDWLFDEWARFRERARVRCEILLAGTRGHREMLAFAAANAVYWFEQRALAPDDD